jgi:hypothetical protein
MYIHQQQKKARRASFLLISLHSNSCMFFLCTQATAQICAVGDERAKFLANKKRLRE